MLRRLRFSLSIALSAFAGLSGCHLLLDDEPFSSGGSSGTTPTTTNGGGGQTGIGGEPTSSAGGGPIGGGPSTGGNGGGPPVCSNDELNQGGTPGAACTAASPACTVEDGDTFFTFDDFCEADVWCAYENGGSFTVEGGALEITAPAVTGWWSPSSSGRAFPPYLFRELTGDFAIVARVGSVDFTENDTQNQYSVAGIIVRDPTGAAPGWAADEHWLKFEWGFRDVAEGDYFELGFLYQEKPEGGDIMGFRDGESTDINGNPALGICRIDDAWSFYAFNNGWINLAPQPPGVFEETVEVGLSTGRWNTAPDGHATFPWVRIRAGGSVGSSCLAAIESLCAGG
ncbi:MAG: hypothetical protein HOW73_42300 [Polyangiaceae bacterium]|nr:hypothetical protein [Polyangiaceae bacterium]